jgi:hypothetical protein
MDELIPSDCPHWYGGIVRDFCHHDPLERPKPYELILYRNQLFGPIKRENSPPTD